MEILLLNSISKKAGFIAITGYQKYISPYKGFVCAHRVLYGGESCSQYIKRVIAKDGFKGLLSKSRTRFQACKQANQILRSKAENSEPTEDEDEANLHSPQKSSSTSGSNSNDCLDCAELGCNGAECLSLNPDCSVLDCNAVDCGRTYATGTSNGALSAPSAQKLHRRHSNIWTF